MYTFITKASREPRHAGTREFGRGYHLEKYYDVLARQGLSVAQRKMKKLFAQLVVEIRRNKSFTSFPFFASTRTERAEFNVDHG